MAKLCWCKTMDFKNLLDDEKAVSPVIGVILMVAITVILAAVIGTFVLGLGDQVQETTPNANFAFDYTEGDTADTLEITHETGDKLEAPNVEVVVSGASPESVDDTYAWDTDLDGGDPVSAGSSVTLDSDTDADLDLSEATVRVTWSSESGDSSSTLAKWSGPEA